MVTPRRVFRGLDSHSEWGNATKYLQKARRYKDREIPAGFLDRALEVLSLGEPEQDCDALFVQCPLCKKQLSPRNVYLGPFVWGEDSVHYLMEHQIWPPELDELLTWAATHQR